MAEKASAKMGYLFAKLNLARLSVDMSKKVFDCSVYPHFSYGVMLWIDHVSNAVKDKVNVVYTKFAKRILGIHRSSNNGFTNFMFGTRSLTHRLEEDARKMQEKTQTQHLKKGFAWSLVDRTSCSDSAIYKTIPGFSGLEKPTKLGVNCQKITTIGKVSQGKHLVMIIQSAVKTMNLFPFTCSFLETAQKMALTKFACIRKEKEQNC